MNKYFLFRIHLFCLLISMLHSAQSKTPDVSPDPVSPTPQLIAQDVWLMPGFFQFDRSPDGNSVIFRTDNGLVVMDTGRHFWHRQSILQFAALQNLPIIAVVNSHWHLDHVSGNPMIKSTYPDVKVYASNAIDQALTGFLQNGVIRLREALKTPNLSNEAKEDIETDLETSQQGELLRPDVIVKESGSVSIGSKKMDLNFAPDGPTQGDVWIYDAGTKIAAVGDLVTLPVPFLDTACVAGWKTALEKVWATPFEILVPGHGKLMSRNDFNRYRVAFNNYVDCANSSKDSSICSAGWLRELRGLIDDNALDPKQTGEWARAYIDQVLRPNGGNSQYCKVGIHP